MITALTITFIGIAIINLISMNAVYHIGREHGRIEERMRRGGR